MQATSTGPTGPDAAGRSAFGGFPDGFGPFLRELGGADKAWFGANRSRYERLVTVPTKAFVVAVGHRLNDEIGPGIVAQPRTNGSIAPINNDLRFAPDRSPYKDHLLLRFWEGEDRRTAPTLFIRIGPDDVGFATGAPIASVERWRSAIDDEVTGGELVAALAELAGGGRSIDIGGRDYKRVPRPFAEDHPRADLLRHKAGFQARWSEPLPAVARQGRFVEFCVRRLVSCAPVHRWLVANL
jgi:uncharacterized protein (TIGR02453 family)